MFVKIKNLDFVFSFLKISLFSFQWVSLPEFVCEHHVCEVTWRSEEDTGSSRTGVIDSV